MIIYLFIYIFISLQSLYLSHLYFIIFSRILQVLLLLFPSFSLRELRLLCVRLIPKVLNLAISWHTPFQLICVLKSKMNCRKYTVPKIYLFGLYTADKQKNSRRPIHIPAE